VRRAMSAWLDRSGSVWGYDKAMKIASYLLPLVAQTCPHRLQTLKEALKLFGSHFSMYRVTTRLGGSPFGLPSELDNIINSSWVGGWKDNVIRRCVILQSYTMLGYYPLEHAVWAGTIAPKLFPLDVATLSRLSCVFWVLWIVIDIYATHRRWQELKRMETKLKMNGSLTANNKAKIERSRRSLIRYTLRLVLYLPNAIHWTLDEKSKFALADWMVNALGLAEAVLGTYTYVNGDSISRPKIEE